MAEQRTEGPRELHDGRRTRSGAAAAADARARTGSGERMRADNSIPPSPAHHRPTSAPSPTPAPSPSPAPAPSTPSPLMSIDIPAAGATVRQAFAESGWALDQSSTTDDGSCTSGRTGVGRTADVRWVGARERLTSRCRCAAYGQRVRPDRPRPAARSVYADRVCAQFARHGGSCSRRPRRLGSRTQRCRCPPRRRAARSLAGFLVAAGRLILERHPAAASTSWTSGLIRSIRAAPIFLGAASVNIARPDAAAVFGAQFGTTGPSYCGNACVRPLSGRRSGGRLWPGHSTGNGGGCDRAVRSVPEFRGSARRRFCGTLRVAGEMPAIGF